MCSVESTCRTCGKSSEQEDGSDLFPMYTSSEYHNELKMIQEEFEIWNLNIAQGDGLPQKICLTCFDSFCQIHNFRIICQEAQINYGELCTGLDIIIKVEPEFGDLDVDFPEDFEGEQTITVQEHYRFPGDEPQKTLDSIVETQSFEKNSATQYENDLVDDEDAIEELNATVPEFKMFQCEFCMDVVSFDDPDLLNEHYNVLHSSDQPYPCPKCDKCFNTKGKRNSHARIHFRIVLECETCGKKVRGGKRMMAQHNELHHVEKARQCTTCGKEFQKITLKRFHYHMSWHDDSKLHKCKYCEKKFIQITHLVVHERTHTGESPFVCSDCGAGFKNSGLLNNHMKMHGLREIECPHCPKKFYHKHGLRVHMELHNPNRKIPRCEICDRPFRSTMNLRIHNHKRHGVAASQSVFNVLRKRETKEKFIKPYKCSKCPQTFVLHTQLAKHLKTHDEHRPYTCDECGKSFKRDAHLKLHVNSLHLNKKPHKCPHCGWAFSQRNNLREHIAAKHEDKRDFKCEICDKAFAISKSLKTHMLNHVDRKPYVCKICGKSFKQLAILKYHINTHLKKNEVDVDAGDITDVVL